jgi:hypothetical protein
MATSDLIQDRNQPDDSTTDATAEIFLLAFKALPTKYQVAVLHRLLSSMPREKQSTAQVLAAIDKDRWTPPPGSPDSLTLLREDRDR